MINTFVALDIETTGLNPAEDKIIEIGMAKISDGEIVDSYSTLVNPGIMLMCDKVTHKKLIDSNLLFRKISRNLLSKMIQYNSKKIF